MYSSLFQYIEEYIFLNSFLSKSPSMNAVIRTTIAPTMLSASTRSNVLSSEAVGVVNFRLHPRDNPETVINYVKKLVENENVEIYDENMTLDNKYNQIFSFEENALYVEMYPMGNKVKNQIVGLNNIVYFRFWDS